MAYANITPEQKTFTSSLMHTRNKNNTGYLLISAALIAILFFDVVFLRGSLQPSNVVAHIGPPSSFQNISFIEPDHQGTTSSHGYSDLGATSWQGEPARHFVANSLKHGELPYWNPYSANGSLAPDTLVDLKFSLFTLLSAWGFDASAASFDFGLIIIFIIAAFSLLKISHQYLLLGALPSMLVVIVYFLNGFASTNYNSQNGQAYFFAPLLLLSLLQWSDKRTLTRWIWMTLCHAMMFLITMLPVMLLSLITCHLMHLAWLSSRDGNKKDFVKTCSLLFASGLVGLMLAAFLWIPVIENIALTSLFGDYDQRNKLTPYHWHNLISIITPKQFWESYNGIRPLDELKSAGVKHDWGTLAHLGLGSLFIASAIVNVRAVLSSRFKWLILCLLVLSVVPYLRIFGLLSFVDDIPIFKIIGRQYWMCMSSLSFCFLAGFGLHQLLQEKHRPWFALAVMAFALFSFISLKNLLGMPEVTSPYFIYIRRLKIFFALYVVAFALYAFFPAARKALVVILVLTATAELFMYINHLRPVRFEARENPPEFVTFLQQNTGNYRIMNIGERRTLQPEFGSMYGIRQLDTNNSSLLPWYKDFYKKSFGTENPLFLLLGSSTLHAKKPRHKNVLDLAALNVASAKYIVVSPAATLYTVFLKANNFPLVYESPHTYIFENTSARPIVYSSNKWVKGAKKNTATDATTVITDDEKLMELFRSASINQQPLCASPEIIKYRNNEVVYKTACDNANILATSETWHPGWRASIDEKDVHVGKINAAFRGIFVPAGKHEIRFHYSPKGMQIGIITSLTTALALCIIFIYFQVRRRG